ncbi:STAS domain-containing protein [Catenuloplanes japonicus]|uniref:STAS domain-containing protein n=1 Tax=Catenuloplanes japonicus TaxID=33876 RepID=UPI00068FF1E0|nr:STAS domain-containing protein [Catenuloplanes japonicus]
MTAVPGQVANMIDLICDRCGDVLSCRADHLRDLEVVWPLLTDQGWAGSPFATGQHTCPGCVVGQLREPSAGATWPVRKHIPRDVVLRQDRHAAIVEVTGDIDRLLVSTMQAALGRAAALHRNTVLDLAAVQLVDPIGLGVLVRGHVRARKRGGHLCLAAPSRFVLTVLHTMHLDDALPVFGDLPSTLTWLAAHPPASAQTPGRPKPPPAAPGRPHETPGGPGQAAQSPFQAPGQPKQTPKQRSS